MEAYCDANFASDTETRRSTTGFVFTLAGGAITWSSKIQPTVAVSTSEAEYMAGAQKIYCDTQGAIKLLKHPTASIRSKHIDVLHHFARDRVMRKEVSFEYCSTESMVADCFTKPLPIGKLKFCCEGMGVV